MRLTHLEVTDHRNIAHAELHPDPHLTVLCGPNGQDEPAGGYLAADRRQELPRVKGRGAYQARL